MLLVPPCYKSTSPFFQGGMYMAQPPAGHMNMVSGMQNGMMGGVQQGNMGMMGNMQGTAGMQQVSLCHILFILIKKLC